MDKLRKALGVVSVNVAVLLGLALLAEAGARAFCDRELEALFPAPAPRADFPMIESHPRRGTALRPLYRDELYRINRDGFRGAELPGDAAERFLLAVVGDSTTFGWGVGEGEDFPAQLQAALHAAGFTAVHVLNAGVPGYTSAQARLYLEEILDRDPAPDAVLLSVLWNDIWYSTITNWHEDFLVFEAPRGAERWLRRYSGLYRCMLLYRASESDLVDVWNEPAFLAYRANLEEAFRLGRDRGVPLVFFDPPFDGGQMPEAGLNRFHIGYSKEFFLDVARRHVAAAEELAKSYGVGVAHHALSMEHLAQGELFLDPLHPNAEGNRLLAHDLARYLMDEGLLGEP